MSDAVASRDFQLLGRVVDNALNGDANPRRFGFALLVFEFGKMDGGRVNYVSSADRETMLTAMKEFIARAEGRVIETETRQ